MDGGGGALLVPFKCSRIHAHSRRSSSRKCTTRIKGGRTQGIPTRRGGTRRIRCNPWRSSGRGHNQGAGTRSTGGRSGLTRRAGHGLRLSQRGDHTKGRTNRHERGQWGRSCAKHEELQGCHKLAPNQGSAARRPISWRLPGDRVQRGRPGPRSSFFSF